MKITSNRKDRSEEDQAKWQLFCEEIDYYTQCKTKEQAKLAEYDRVLKGCSADSMFESCVKNMEKKTLNCKMPVRKFFDNTFENLLNDALFALQKDQLRHPEKDEIFLKGGMVKAVAQYIFDHPPDAERAVQEDRTASD